MKSMPSQFSAEPHFILTDDEKALLDIVNKARKDIGMGKLDIHVGLVKTARLKANDMVTNKYFSHQSPIFGSPFDMLRNYRVNFKTAGENIAGNNSVENAFDRWMNSEGHRRNILYDKFHYTGIGIVECNIYGKILVQHFIG